MSSMNMNRQQQSPDDSSSAVKPVAAAAAAENSTHKLVSSASKDLAGDDFTFVCEEGLQPAPIDDDDEVRDDINELQSLRRISNISIGEREITERCLPEDTFSFLIYSEVISLATFWALYVFSIQITIYVIIGFNIIDISNGKNPVGFPPNVEIPVRISEALAIAISIITQEDVRKSISLYRDGFEEDLANAFEGATVAKWSISIVLRASQGLLGLSITFLLIMRSKSVLDLLLNFSAIEFVSKLDDVVFALASEGFLGRVVRKRSKAQSKQCYNTIHSSANLKAASVVTIAYFVILFTVFFAGWTYIFWKQEKGKYLCDEIFGQFGDDVLRMLGTISGLLYRQDLSFEKGIFGKRLSYTPKGGGALLAYCEGEKRWTLSQTDPCNWLAASSESVDFNVLKTGSSPWVVRTPSQRVLPLEQHFLACYDGTCGNGKNCARGVDEDKYGCKEGYYGLLCEKQEPPCPSLEIDPRGEGFVREGGRYFASKYYRLKDVETYNHPVYTSLGDKEALKDDIDFILFTGVRWIMSSKHLFTRLRDINNEDGLADYFSRFHARNFSEYSVSFYSEPVHIVTLADVDDTASPLGVRWFPYMSQKDANQWLDADLEQETIETSFFCVVCNKITNPCKFGGGGNCHSNGTCGGCINGYSGTMCQIAPTSNSDGKCDPQFNNINSGFDGGDCCESTCRSTSENTCGKADLGYIDTGYPSCKSASNQWLLSGDPVYGVSSASRSGQAVALSGKGTLLAVADPDASIVRLFDKDGAEWKQRGRNIQDLSDSFGLAISLSDESFNITRNPVSYPTVSLAIGAPKLGTVRVFKCSTAGCIQRGEDILGGFRFGSSLSIAKDGDTVAIGGAARELITPTGKTTNGDVKVFTWSTDVNNWQLKGNGTIARRRSRILSAMYQFSLQGYYVSLSGDYLATGTLEGEVTPEPRYESVNLITQVYKWDNSRWNQLGDEISKEFHENTSFGTPWPRKSVVIKGSVLAVGSYSSVDVYSWNETSQEWNPRMVELARSFGFVGWSVDLSDDANILTIGTSTDNAKTTDESFVRLYQWDGSTYKALFNGVLGGPDSSVSLSSDGKAVAVGLPFDAKGGTTRVYSLQSSPCTNTSEMPLRISFTTDASPEETSWELRVDSEVKRSSGSLAGYMYTTFVEEICVPINSCVKFVAKDTRGDGLNPPGVFALMLNGTEVARGGDFEFYSVTSFGNCECSEDEANFTLATWSNFKPADWSLLKKNTLTPYTGLKLVASEDSFFTVVDECIPKDCYYLSSLQNDSSVSDDNCTMIYNAMYNGTSILPTPTSKYGHVFCDLSGYTFGEC